MKAFVEHLEELVRIKMALIGHVLELFKLELKLAGLSIYSLMLNIGMILVIFATLWATLMMGLAYATFQLWNSHWLALGMVLAFNLIASLILLKCVSLNLKAIGFPKTRHYFLSTKEQHGVLQKKDSQ